MTTKDMEALLAKMHKATAEMLLADLMDPEKRTPGLYQCALRFLKDNGIGAAPVEGSATADLDQYIKFHPGETG